MEWFYRLVSGTSPGDCAAIARRALSPDDPYAADEWLIVHRTGKRGVTTSVVHRFERPQATGLWRAPGGVVWVTLPGGAYAASPPYSPKKGIKDRNLPMHGPLAHGVWGLDDKTVFAWSAAKNMHGAYTLISRGSGRSWTEVGRPKARRINALHGASADSLIAVGTEGYAAHWDGTTWTPIPTATDEELIGVQVAGEVVFAITRDTVLRGSAAGLAPVCTGSELCALAVFAEQIWIGTRTALLRLEGDALVVVDDALPARGLAVGDVLLVASDDAIVGIDASGARTRAGGDPPALTAGTEVTRPPLQIGAVGPFVIERDDGALGVPWPAPPSHPVPAPVVAPAGQTVYVDKSKPALAPGRDGHWLVTGSRDLPTGRQGVIFELDADGQITMTAPIPSAIRQVARVDDDRWLLLGFYGVHLLCRRGETGEITAEETHATDMPPCLHGSVGVVPFGLDRCRLVYADGESLGHVELPYPINGAGVDDQGALVVWDDVARVALRIRQA